MKGSLEAVGEKPGMRYVKSLMYENAYVNVVWFCKIFTCVTNVEVSRRCVA